MKKLARFAAFAAAACLILAAAAALAVRLLLPPEKLKALAVAQAAKSLNRTLEVRDAGLGLKGLRVEGLRLSESPDFSKGEFLTAERLIVKPQWLPLLRRKIVVGAVELSGVRVAVTKAPAAPQAKPGAEPKPVASAKPAPAPKPAPTAQPAAQPAKAEAPAAGLPLSVKSLRLEDVSLRYSDPAQDSTADLKIVRADADGFSLSGPFAFSVELQADYAAGGKRYAGSFKANGTADLGGGDPARAGAEIARFSAGLLGKELTGTLRLEPGSPSKLALTAEIPALDAAYLNSALGAGSAPEGLQLPPVAIEAALAYAAPRLEVTGVKATAAGMRLSVSASVADISAKDPRLAAELSLAVDPLDSAALQRLAPSAGVPDGLVLPKISLSAAAVSDGETLTLKRLELLGAGLQARASGSVGGLRGKAMSYSLKLDTNDFPLASLAQGADSMKAFALGGAAALSATLKGTSLEPRPSGTLTLSGVAGRYQGQTLENLSGQARFTGDTVTIPRLSGRLNGGDFRLKLSAASGAAPAVAVSGWMSVLDLGTLQKLGSPPEGAAGKPVAKASAGSAGKEPAAAQDSPRQAAPSAKTSPARAAAAARSAAAALPLKTSGDLAVDKIVHPNFESGRAAVSWNLTGVSSDMKGLAGSAKLSVAAGRATNLLAFAAARGGLVRALVVPLEMIQKARGLRIPGFTPPDMQNIPFHKIQGDYRAVAGILSMQPFLFDSPSVNVATTGSVDLGAQTLDLKTALKAPMGELDLSITGPLSSPSIRPDLSRQIKSVGKQLMEKQGRQLLEKQGKDLLKKLFH